MRNPEKLLKMALERIHGVQVPYMQLLAKILFLTGSDEGPYGSYRVTVIGKFAAVIVAPMGALLDGKDHHYHTHR